jgi:hypothetical protein
MLQNDLAYQFTNMSQIIRMVYALKLCQCNNSSLKCCIKMNNIYLFQCTTMGASRLAGSLFFKDDDPTHTYRCHTHDMLLPSLSPLCITRLACMSLYYTVAYGTCLVFNSLTPAFSLLLSVKL